MKTPGDTSIPYSLNATENGAALVLSLAAGSARDEAVSARIESDIASLKLAVDVDMNAVEQALLQSRDGRDAEAVIAKGEPCRHGTDGKVLWAKKLLPADKGGGRVSHYLGRLEKKIVKKGDPVARFVPEGVPVDGRDVYGKTIKAQKGRPVTMRAGAGLREAEGIVYAEKDGIVRVENNILRLDETFLVDGDLDFDTGNVDFPGSVVIGGSVLDLFQVKAGGSIQIKGVVEAATLSAKGDIVIVGGLAGKNKGRVITEESVGAQFLVNACVSAGGDVCVESEVLSSRVTALGAVKVAGGSIAGGRVEALGGVYAATLGSDIGTPTEVAAGICPALPQIIEANSAQIDDAKARLLSLKRSLISCERSRTGSHMELARQEIREIQAHLCTCLSQRKRLAQAWQAAKPVIVVEKMIFPGVSVTVGPYKLEINSEIQGPVKLRADHKTRRVKIVTKG